MSEMDNKAAAVGMQPGVCVPWADKLKEFPVIAGNSAMVQKEWEKLDAMVYCYLWYWVHR